MLSFDTLYIMMRQLFLLDENCHCKYNVASKLQLLQVDHCKYGMSDVARAVVALRNCSQHSAMSRSQPKMPNYLQHVSGAKRTPLSPYSTGNGVRVGYQTQMKSTPKTWNVHGQRQHFALGPNATHIPLTDVGGWQRENANFRFGVGGWRKF